MAMELELETRGGGGGVEEEEKRTKWTYESSFSCGGSACARSNTICPDLRGKNTVNSLRVLSSCLVVCVTATASSGNETG